VSWAAAILLVLATAFAGYHQIFSTNAEYDDEGYVMLSLASFLDGKPLYDATFTQYGPSYYLVEGAFFRATGLPISHDVTRLKTLVLWLLASALGAAVIRRAGGSRWACIAGFLVTFFHLERLCLEPGHPQEICVIGTLAVPLLAGLAGTAASPRAWTMALGIVVGIVAMAKVNVGAYAFVAAAVALSLVDGLGRRALAGVVAGAAMVPFLVTSHHLRAPGGIVLPTVVVGSLLGIAIVAARRRTPSERPSQGGANVTVFIVATTLTIGGLVVATLALGTSLTGVWYGLVGQHAAFVRTFASPAQIPGVAALWAILAVGMAAFAGRHPRLADACRAVAVAGLAWTCTRYTLETLSPLTHGLVDRGGSGVLIGIATPVLWVLLVGRTCFRTRWATRVTLCLVAALSPLGAYPTPGTQMAIGAMPSAIACVLMLDDALHEGRRRHVTRAVAPIFIGLLLGTLVGRDVWFARYAASLSPLDLPGATLVRMPPRDAARYRWLTETLRAHSDTFVFREHARNSFYFWTRLPPPTGLNPTFWPHLLRRSEQQHVVTALAGHRRVAVVHEPSFNGALPADSVLLDYLSARFRPALADDGFEVWLPDEPGSVIAPPTPSAD
jgi:hypothetical protein